jgi:drug/metabolite transporter (DMT)-like permease
VSRGVAVALLLVAATVWGATFSVVKAALADAGAFTFLALRFGLATLIFLPALRNRRALAGAGRAVFCGVALFTGYAFQTLGLASTTPARSAFITAFSVVLVPLLEGVTGLARVHARVWLGGAIALGGLALLLGPERQPFAVGDLLTLGCAVAFAAHVLLLQWAVQAIPPTRVAAVQIFATAALAFPAAAIAGWHAVATPRLAGAVFVCAVLATVAAFWIMTAVQEVLSASLTAVVLAFEPVAAAVVSVAFGADLLTPALVAGGAVVVAGVVIATRAPVRPTF